MENQENLGENRPLLIVDMAAEDARKNRYLRRRNVIVIMGSVLSLIVALSVFTAFSVITKGNTKIALSPAGITLMAGLALTALVYLFNKWRYIIVANNAQEIQPDWFDTVSSTLTNALTNALYKPREWARGVNPLYDPSDVVAQEEIMPARDDDEQNGFSFSEWVRNLCGRGEDEERFLSYQEIYDVNKDESEGCLSRLFQ